MMKPTEKKVDINFNRYNTNRQMQDDDYCCTVHSIAGKIERNTVNIAYAKNRLAQEMYWLVHMHFISHRCVKLNKNFLHFTNLHDVSISFINALSASNKTVSFCRSIIDEQLDKRWPELLRDS